jgi:hypothetical protein
MDDQIPKAQHAAELQEQKSQLLAEGQATALSLLYQVARAIGKATLGDAVDALPNAQNELASIAAAYPFLPNSGAQAEVMSCLSGIAELHSDRARLHRILFLNRRIAEYQGLIVAEAKTLTAEQVRDVVPS